MAQGQDSGNTCAAKAPSRKGRVQVTAYVDVAVRRELRGLAAKLDVTMQHLMCKAVNDLLEQHGCGRLADETILPRGGAAHGRANRD